MTTQSRGALADAPFNSAAPEDWVLTISTSGRPRLTGVDLPVAERGSVQAVFHGVLFDRPALASAVGCHRDAPDADLVAAAYDCWHDDALLKLRGSFIAAIVDHLAGRAIVARDAVGLHPLFYASRSGEVTFASSPEALFSKTETPRRFNRAALADHLCYRWPDPQETFYESVRRVPAGSCVTIACGRVSVARYWNPIPDDRPMDWLDASEVDQFGDLLNQAVDRCLSTGPAGIFLSGGLDSISVAAVASDRARHLSQPAPVALSLGFPHPECDERLVQTAVARDLGLPHHLIEFPDAVAPHGMFALALEMNEGASSPVNSSWSPAYQTLARRGRLDGVETILTGSGGDEWLTVSVYYAADLLRRGRIGEYRRFVSTWWRSYRASPFALVRSALWKFGLRPLAGQALARLAPEAWERRRQARAVRRDPEWAVPDPELRAELKRRSIGSLVQANPPHGFYLRDIRAGLDHPLLAMELEERYEFGSRTGVRLLHPYWDTDLVDMLIRTPPALLDRGGRSKGLVRQTLAQRFPDLGFDRQRKIAATPFYVSMLKAEGLPLLDNLGSFSALGELGIVNPASAKAFAEDAFARNPNQLHHVWDLLNVETWVRCS
jgi:asparagine synthase (glutamine-hydrolysing)